MAVVESTAGGRLELVAADASDRLLREALRRGSVRKLSTIVPSLSEIYREVTA